MRSLGLAILLMTAAPATAELMPQPGPDNPRLQTVQWQPNQEILLTVLPEAGLTVMLEAGEQITRATISDASTFDVRVSPELDSFIVLPLTEAASGTLEMTTDRRDYSFALRTGTGLMAGLLVRFEYGAAEQQAVPVARPPVGSPQMACYRFKGDREVRPEEVRDDGARTWITFGPDQALPAVFAIGPTGDEEVVNGHMRGGLYVIDRVYDELVFRIDRRRATARREPDESNSG